MDFRSLAAIHINVMAVSNDHSWDLGPDCNLATIDDVADVMLPAADGACP